MESPQRDSRIGVVLNGRYRITELLGEGGMGMVYRGERLQLGRPVAIKFLHSPYAKSPKYMARFEREARAMSKLSHPYCVSVIDFGVHDEPYIVMDFVTGETLRDLMDRVRMSPQRAIQITRQILAGLAHAHSQGVIHRDIKPGNIMIGEATGVGDHVRIFDFGLAKLHDPSLEHEQSMATVIGTPAYMAPEQTRAEASDARVDLYATGILLFELLTGEKPFVGEDAYAVIRLHREEPPPALRARAPGLSVELEQVVKKALEKDRERRFQTGAEFLAALDTVPEAYRRSLAAAEIGGGVSRGVDSQPSSASDPGFASELKPSGFQPRAERTSTSAAELDDAARSRRQAFWMLLFVAGVGAFTYLTARSKVPESQARPESPAPARPEPELRSSPLDDELAPGLDAGLLVILESEVEGFAASDAAALEPEPSELSAELAAADRALDLSEESEAQPIASPGPEVQSISDVHALIDRRQFDGAIFGLRALREKSPYNPYLPYLLGDLYFERGWWSDGLAKYREAIRLNDGYRKRATMHKNAIRALGKESSYARARVFLSKDLGSVALTALEQASESDPDPLVKERAREIAEQVAR